MTEAEKHGGIYWKDLAFKARVEAFAKRERRSLNQVVMMALAKLLGEE